jgi:hypothetical protein
MSMDGSQALDVQVQKSFVRRFSVRVHDAIPSPHLVLLGSAIWGGLIAVSAIAGIWMHNGLLIVRPLAVVSLYFYGGALGFAPGLLLASLLFARSGTFVRLAGGTIVMMLATHTATAGIFALQYRVFYSHWHATFPNIIWFFQLAFTSAGAVYQYSVDSIYYYWPFTVLCFLGFGLWFARHHLAKPH